MVEFHMETSGALRIFGLCGLVGVFVDIDHAAALLLWRYWNQEISNGRLWHAPLFALSGIVICCLCARLGRLHYKFFLIGAVVAVITALVLIYSPWVTWGLYE